MRDGGWYERPVPTASTSLLDRAVALSGRDPAWRTSSACMERDIHEDG